MTAAPVFVGPEASLSPEGREEALWRAVVARDERGDGRFVFGVRSTGIYCRPSCPARRPRRERVAFFATSSEAERAGFRPCRRCTPLLFDDAMSKRRLDAELKAAAALHARLQPAPLPGLSGWDVSAACVPCREVGGDYVDYFRRAGDGRLIVALGDVAGKGMGAALLMSSLHAAVHAQAETGAAPSAVLGGLNRYIHASTPAEAYATLFYGEIDLDSGVLTGALAGHNAPLLRGPQADPVRLEAGGVPLGLLPEASYEQESMLIPKGSLLLAYSDGITEWTSPEGEEFGEARLADLLGRLDAPAAGCARDRVREAVWRFARGDAPSDDLSLLVVARAAAT